MAFNLENLRSDARYLVFGDSTNTEYGDIDLDRNINRWYNTILAWVLSSNGDWQVNGDFVVTDIVAGQREYILPTDLLKLNEVYIKSTSTGEYLKATQKDLKSITTYNLNYYPSTPEFDVLDNSLFLYIPEATITDVTEGLRLVYQKNLTELENTTDAPNLSEPFKRGISIGAAMDYCDANELSNKSAKLEIRLYGNPSKKDSTGVKGEIKEHYSNKSTAKEVKITPTEENFT